MASFRVDVDMRLDRLDKAIRNVSKVTGKTLTEAVDFAAYEFALQAGKAMPPKNGLSVGKDKKRRTWEEKAYTFPPGGSERGTVQGVLFMRSKKKQRRYYRKKAEANKKRIIKNRGLAKQQFWRAMELIMPAKGGPGRAWSMPGAKAQARQHVKVRKGRDIFLPFNIVQSDIDTAAGYRPYAQIIGLRKAATRLNSMVRRIKKEQQAAWK